MRVLANVTMYVLIRRTFLLSLSGHIAEPSIGIKQKLGHYVSVVVANDCKRIKFETVLFIANYLLLSLTFT